MTLTVPLSRSVRHTGCLPWHFIDLRQAAACALISAVLELTLTAELPWMHSEKQHQLLLLTHHLFPCWLCCSGFCSFIILVDVEVLIRDQNTVSVCVTATEFCVNRHWGQVGHSKSALCIILKETHWFYINRLSVMWCLAGLLWTSCDFSDNVVSFSGCVFLL